MASGEGYPRALPAGLAAGQPLTALAPMQDVTDRPFLRIIGRYGAPDLLFTEYFRVHVQSRPEKHILDAILHHDSGRPIFAQLIGEDVEHLARTARALADYPIAGIDLNLGCPAPRVYKKNVGGGLLRDVAKVEAIVRTLREVAPHRFTVKMRVGFACAGNFADLLEVMARHRVDLVSLHARLVKDGYRGEPDYRTVAQAAGGLPCPVLANGNLTSAAKAWEVIRATGCGGAMLGRGAIRNPWVFRQFRELLGGGEVYQPTLSEVRVYVDDLWRELGLAGLDDFSRLNRMKKLLNFVGTAVDAEGAFLHDMRRSRTPSELFAVCNRHLLEGGRGEEAFPTEPYAGVLARPNQESPLEEACA